MRGEFCTGQSILWRAFSLVGGPSTTGYLVYAAYVSLPDYIYKIAGLKASFFQI